jgi:PAS domain S-box-containing protein
MDQPSESKPPGTPLPLPTAGIPVPGDRREAATAASRDGGKGTEGSSRSGAATGEAAAIPTSGRHAGGNGGGKRGVTAAEALAAELHREIARREELERRLADAESQLARSEALVIRHRTGTELQAASGAPKPRSGEQDEVAEAKRRLEETSSYLQATEHRLREAELQREAAEARWRAAESRLQQEESRASAQSNRLREVEEQFRALERQLREERAGAQEVNARLAESEHRPAPADLRAAHVDGRHSLNEQRFAYLMSSSLGFFDDNTAAGTTFFSPACLDMLGFRADELLLDRQKFLELLHPDDLHSAHAAERSQVVGGMSRFTLHFRLRHKDGNYRWIESTGMEFKDATGKRLRAMGFYRDITAQKALEECLHQREERFNLLVGDSPLGFFDTDLPEGTAYYSARWKNLLGYQPGELQDTHELWLDLVHPEDRAGIAALHVQRGAGERRRSFSHAVRLQSKDGRYRWFQTAGVDFFGRDGQLLRMLGFLVDIDVLKGALETLAHEKESLGIMLDSISDGVITTDADGRITFLNAAAEGLCGLSAKEAGGLAVEEFYRRTGAQVRRQADNPVRAVLASGMRAAPHDPAHLTSPGRPEKVIADNAAPITNPAGKVTGAVLVFHDITDRHRAAEEMQKAGRIESLGVLAGGIAHDFNNLLTSILGNLSVARSGGDLPIRALDALGRAEKACWRARDLTGQLLTFAKGGDPVRTALDLAPLLEETVRNATANSGVQATFQVAANLPTIEADQGQIVQVIQNLALNAVQAMPGGGKLHVSMELIRSPQDLAAIDEVHESASAYVEIKMRDAGTGIAPEHLSKIFDPFFSTRTNGTGLGLAIAYSIVRKHDGVIRVDSRPGAGSTFTIYLPVSPSVGLPPIPSQPARDERRAGGRVLFMDDDPDIRDLAGAILDLIGYDPTLTAEGTETLAEYQAARAAGQPYAAVILDLTIPGGMGGKETIRRLREIDPEVRAIVSSGYSNDAVIADFRAHGFRAMVAKPYRMEDLARALTTAITGEGLQPAAGE